MRRVLIIGSGGAGKSTLARRIGARTGLPVIHLDALYWTPGWVETPPDVWRETVAVLLLRDAWVMDGHYGGTLDARLAAADTVVFLDLPRAVCLGRVVRRWARFRGTGRPSMAPGCPERLDAAFAWWVWTYPQRRRSGVLAKLAALPPATHVVVFRSSREVDRFVAALPVAA